MKKYYVATRGQLFRGVETGGWRTPLISGEQLRKQMALGCHCKAAVPISGWGSPFQETDGIWGTRVASIDVGSASLYQSCLCAGRAWSFHTMVSKLF